MTKPQTHYESTESSQSEFVRRAIGEEIMTGRLRPGDFLSESRLADKYGVSRTPVREAIRLLAGDRLVKLRPGQRSVVRGQTVAEVLDQFEAMSELESACARLAARRRSEQDLRRMERAQAMCKAHAKEADTDSYYSANVIFHEAIYAASGNHYLQTETLRLRDRLRFLRITQGRLPGRLDESASEHEEVLEAIRTHQEDAAAEAMRGHLIVQGESLRTMLKHTDPNGVVSLAELSGALDPNVSYSKEEET